MLINIGLIIIIQKLVKKLYNIELPKLSREYVIDSDENSEYMYNTIAEIIDKCGPRAPCSAAESKASELVAERLKEYCDSVNIEKFNAYPRAFLGWIRLDIGLIVISFIMFLSFYWFYLLFGNILILLIGTLICLGMGLFGLLIFYKQFFNYKEWTPKFLPYKKGTSQNVIGVIKPSSDIRKRVVFSAHIDSAFRFNLQHYTKQGYAYFFIAGVIALISFIILYLIQLIFIFLTNNISVILTYILIWIILIIPIFLAFYILILGKSKKVLYGSIKNVSLIGYVLILAVTAYNLFIDILFWNYYYYNPNILKIVIWMAIKDIPVIFALFFFLSKKATPGAIDNLSAVAPVMCIAKILKDWKENHQELFPKTTEVVISIVGSEEIGLRGSEAFAKKHAVEYNKINTTVVNCESLSESRYQKIFTRENTTRTDLSPEVYNRLAECCEDLKIDYKLCPMPSVAGGTDAAGFVRGELKASSLEGIIWEDYLWYYHTDRDNLSLINKKRRPCTEFGANWKNRNVRCAMENGLKICLKYLEKVDKA